MKRGEPYGFHHYTVVAAIESDAEALALLRCTYRRRSRGRRRLRAEKAVYPAFNHVRTLRSLIVRPWSPTASSSNRAKPHPAAA